jgi:hypothetical protein
MEGASLALSFPTTSAGIEIIWQESFKKLLQPEERFISTHHTVVQFKARPLSTRTGMEVTKYCMLRNVLNTGEAFARTTSLGFCLTTSFMLVLIEACSYVNNKEPV